VSDPQDLHPFPIDPKQNPIHPLSPTEEKFANVYSELFCFGRQTASFRILFQCRHFCEQLVMPVTSRIQSPLFHKPDEDLRDILLSPCGNPDLVLHFISFERIWEGMIFPKWGCRIFWRELSGLSVPVWSDQPEHPPTLP
jgi:hypothetical protein